MSRTKRSKIRSRWSGATPRPVSSTVTRTRPSPASTLTVISIFQTDRPVRMPKGGIIRPDATPLPGPLRASRAGKLIQWTSGARHYTLMGDVSRELVADIIKSLR